MFRRKTFCFALVIVASLLHLPAAEQPRALADDSRPADRSALETGARDLDDRAIANAIAKDLSGLPGLTTDKVSVDVDDGLVTLAGSVDNLLAKRRATAIAKRTRGVQAVLNRVMVRGQERSNEELRTDIIRSLASAIAVDEPQIAVSIHGGSVSIAGKVDSLAEKRIAESTVAGVRGVREVINQLTVQLPRERADADLQREIQLLIEHSVYLDDADIDVVVNNHEAILRGTAASVAAKDHAEQIAEVIGILRVDADQVRVDPELSDGMRRRERYASLSDESVANAIRRVFRADPFVFSHADEIDVQVDRGVVVLTGSVTRLPIKKAAQRLAKGVIGVHSVLNQLTVDYPDESPSDAQIIRETQLALKRSPYLNRRDFRIHCQAAHVRLYGVVNSQPEKQLAEQIAAGVEGVVHVNNALAIEGKWQEKSDAAILADLQRKLKYAFFDASNDLRVTVTDGVAVLRGEVDTWRQWQTALDLALEAGSRHPHNLIRVRFHPPHHSPRTYVPVPQK